MGRMLEAGTIILPQSKTLPNSNIEMPYIFVGDEAFPLKSYIMRPYPRRHLNLQKSVFNFRLSRARRVYFMNNSSTSFLTRSLPP
nr:unnamed protein product [Callosobruchus chinensis]